MPLPMLASLTVMLDLQDFPEAPFTPAMLRERGITRRALADAVHAYLVRRVLRGVYQRADTPDTVHTRVAAAKLVISEHSVVCDRTAAWIHGVEVFAWHETEVLPPIESFVLRGHAPSRRQGVAGGSRDLKGVDVIDLDGLLVTSPVRTALDLACKLSARDGLAALDAFMRRFGITRSELRRLLVRYFRRRGVRRARPLVAMADARSESPGESWTRYEILTHGLPPPTPQAWVDIDGAPTYRLDLPYSRHRVVVEYDGEEFHTSDNDREYDRQRRAWLRRHGWIVIVVDRNSFTDDAVSAWIAELRSAIASRTYGASRASRGRISREPEAHLNEPGGASVRCP